jgi:hypothetical protein
MRCLRVKSKTTKTMSQTISANPASGIVNITNQPPTAIGYSKPPESRPRTMHGWIEPSSSWQPKAEANSTADSRVSSGKVPNSSISASAQIIIRFGIQPPRLVRFRGKQPSGRSARGNARALRPFGQARAGGWGGRGRSSCRATDAAIKPEARAQTPISLSGDLTCPRISVVAGCKLRGKRL